MNQLLVRCDIEITTETIERTENRTVKQYAEESNKVDDTGAQEQQTFPTFAVIELAQTRNDRHH